jgi:GxxExxY protein
MYRKILAIELASQGLDCASNVQIDCCFNGRVLVHHSSEDLLINQKYLLHVRSIVDYPTRYDFGQTKTYLNSLRVKIGLIANFGKNRLQIFGVNPD